MNDKINIPSNEKQTSIPILLPLMVWSCVGLFVFGFSNYYENQVCQFDDSNYQKDRYTSPQHEHDECLKAYHNITMMFGFFAFGFGGLLSFMLWRFKQQEVRQQ